MPTPVRIKSIKRISSGKSLVADVTVADNNNLFVQGEISNSAVLAHNCALIENHFDIKIEGWILLYVARDNPAICRAVSGIASSKQKARILKTIGRYDVQYSRVSQLSSWSDILWLVEQKPCKTREQYEQFYAGFKGCPLHSVCFTKQLLPTMKLEFKEGIQSLKKL